jgi:queuine tRNA-ribosyltransferase
MQSLHLPHGELSLPEFLPDATRGYVRAVDSLDLEACGTQALVMNTFHLMQAPGSSTIQSLGGLHTMSGWPRPILTDSGGFQIYSLIHQNPKFGSINNKGATFRSGEAGDTRKYNLTPEKSIQLQIGYGSDIVICLDDCTHVDAPELEQRESVRRTLNWAKRGKEEYLRLLNERKIPEANRPLIFAVIQGGGFPELRRECAEGLLEIGFDGYGYGGWPLDSQGHLLVDLLSLVRELVPERFPVHALGVAHPANVVECIRLGYDLCDGAMPTRDARHARLYAFQVDPNQPGQLGGDWFSFMYVLDDKYIKWNSPVSPYCDCLLCTRYSLGYLHHLFKQDDSLALRLATIHNLRFMAQLSAHMREERNYSE